MNSDILSAIKWLIDNFDVVRKRLAPVLSLAITIGAFAVVLSRTAGLGDPTLVIAVGTVTVISVGMVLYALQTIRGNPTTYSVALLGLPGSGKTVYVAVLFDTLMGGKVDEVSFSPYGLETTERVGQDMDQLLHGRWLPATETTTVFSYRANAYVGSGLRQRSYKLEITDYAGEYTTEFVPGGASWLHRSDYFRYVTRSDAVFLIVDAGLIMADADRTRSLESSYVAAVEALVEAKGQSGARMINTPVGLVFTKLDLVLSDEKDSKTAVDELASRLPRLVGRCRSLCRHFATFAVSAVGSLSPDGGPPAELRPLGVVEPLRWVLTRTTRP